MNQVYSVQLLKRHWLSSDVYELTCNRPPDFSFLAGQHVAVQHGRGERKYTILSSESEQELRFLIKKISGGEVSSALAELPEGARLQVSRPQGYFVDRESSRPLVFIATGTGIAPFISMLKSGTKADYLLYGVKDISQFLFPEIIIRGARHRISCLTEPGENETGVEGVESFYGRVTGYLENRLAPGLYDFYLCGNRNMISDSLNIIDTRFPGANAYSEFYN